MFCKGNTDRRPALRPSGDILGHGENKGAGGAVRC
jgi:hypothetical protein